MKLSANVAQYIAAMRSAGSASEEMAAKSKATLGKLGGDMQSVGKKMSLGLTVPLVGMGVAAVKAASTFQTSFTQMQSLAGVTAGEIEGMQEAVKGLAGETGRSPLELADALYTLRSSGLDADQAMSALEVSAKASATGLGNTAVIADAVSSAMNAYATSGMDAARATDVLVATARAGKAEPEQLAASLGRILPISSELGISLEDVGGAIASLSLAGNDAASASTLLTNVMSKLLKPSQQGAEALRAVGLSTASIRQSIADNGLLSTLEMLRERLGESGFVKFMEDAQAVNGALALTGDNAAKARDVFDEVNNSVGASGSAFETWANGPGAGMAKAWAEIQVSMIEAGEAILPALSKIVGVVGDVASAFNDLPEPVQTAVVAFAGLVALAGPMLIFAGSVVKNIAAIKTAMVGLSATAATTKTAMLGFLGPAGLALGGALIGKQLVDGNHLKFLGIEEGDFEKGVDVLHRWATLRDLREEIFAPFKAPELQGSIEFLPEPPKQAVPYGPMPGQMGPYEPQSASALAAAAKAYRAIGVEAGVLNGHLLIGEKWTNAMAASMGRLSAEQAAYGGTIDDIVVQAREQIVAYEELQQGARDFVSVTSGADWGAASFQGATTAMSAFNQQHFALANTAMATEGAYDALGASLKENGYNFDFSTEKGRSNQQALQSLAGTLDSQFVSAYDNANGSMDTFMASAGEIESGVLTRLQDELGLSAEQARELADKLGLTAGDYEARFELAGIEEAKLKLDLLSGSIEGLPEDVETRVNQLIIAGDYEGALAEVDSYYAGNPATIQAVADTAVAEAGLEGVSAERTTTIIANALTGPAAAGLDTTAQQRIADIIANAVTQAADEGLTGVAAEERIADIVAFAIYGDADGALDGVSEQERTAIIEAIAQGVGSAQGLIDGVHGKTVYIDVVTRGYSAPGYGDAYRRAMAAAGQSSTGRFVAGGSNFLTTTGELSGSRGDEVILPLGDQARMSALVNDPRVLGRLMPALGLSGGGGGGSSMTSVTNAPVINFNGPVNDPGAVEQAVGRALRDAERRQLAGSRY